jgi:hypothetical protein
MGDNGEVVPKKVVTMLQGICTVIIGMANCQYWMVAKGRTVKIEWLVDKRAESYCQNWNMED